MVWIFAFAIMFSVGAIIRVIKGQREYRQMRDAKAARELQELLQQRELYWQYRSHPNWPAGWM